MGGVPFGRRRAARPHHDVVGVEARPESYSDAGPPESYISELGLGEDEPRQQTEPRSPAHGGGGGGGVDPISPPPALQLVTVPVSTPPSTLALDSATDVPVTTGDRTAGPDVSDVPTHIVFVIDRSGSMGTQDVRPTMPRFSSTHNNRLGCVYEAILRFIRTRVPENQPDVVSVILFHNSPSLVMEAEPISETMVDRLKDFHPDGGTDYGPGLSQAATVLHRVSGAPGMREKHPVVVFLSDGQTSDTDSPITIIHDMKRADPRLVLHTIQFGADHGGARLLKEMADAGSGTADVTAGSDTDPNIPPTDTWRHPPRRGTYQVSIDQEELGSVFEILASNLSSRGSEDL